MIKLLVSCLLPIYLCSCTSVNSIKTETITNFVDISSTSTKTFSSLITISFNETAIEHGAPKNIPPLLAYGFISPKELNIHFDAMGLRIWSINWNTKGISEKRHRFLDSHVKAQEFIRDFTLAHWPSEKIKDIYGMDNFKETENSRTLLKDGVPFIRIENALDKTIITNYIEGYKITISHSK